MVFSLHALSGVMMREAAHRLAATEPPRYVRRLGSRDPRRFTLMALPLVPILLFVGLVVAFEREVPVGRVPIQDALYCCSSERDAALIEAASASTSPPSSVRRFRPVYTRQESRSIEVAQFLEVLHPGMPQAERRRVSALLVRLGEHYGYEPALIVAVIMTESSFDPRSRSHMGALGLMQILPRTGESLAVETQRPWAGAHVLFDPYLNISLGVRYLAKLQKRFGSLETALVAYNYGPSRVEEMIRRGEPLPMGYTRRVLTRYEQFQSLERYLRL